MAKMTAKKALLTSILSLLVCITMLVGTTFAWFTDSVTSGTNKIIAGNLDVELYHTNDQVADQKITSTTKLFTDVELWEPGALVVETFTVKNEGTLALKYAFSLNQLTAGVDYNTVTWTGDETPHNLTEVIKGTLTKTTPVNREAAKALTYRPWQELSQQYLVQGALEAGASESFTVALYWKDNANEVDNLFNLKNSGWTLSDSGEELFINLSVSLIATQYTSESDSFDNQYDSNSNNTINVSSALFDVSTLTDTTITTSNKAATVVVSKELAEATGVTSVKLIAEGLNTETTGDSNNDIKVTYTEVNLVDQNNVPVDLTGNTNDILTTLFVGKGITGKITVILGESGQEQTFVYDPANAASNTMTYNATTGEVQFTVLHFCPAKIIVEGVVASTGSVANADLTFYTVETAAAAAATGDQITVYDEKNNTEFQTAVIEAIENNNKVSYVAMVDGVTYNNIYDAVAQFKAGSTLTLLDDITVTEYVTSTGYCERPCAFDTPNFKYGMTFDGNNHTITLAGTETVGSLFGNVGGTVKNLTVKGLTTALALDIYTGAEFNKVTAEGEMVVSGNCGGFAIYAWDRYNIPQKIQFIDCKNKINMTGTGTKSDYNAAFIGYLVYTRCDVYFNGCINEANIICGSSGMFIGNPCNASGKVYINNCLNNGLIQRTYLPEDNLRHNNIIYGVTSDYAFKTVIDGVEYTMAQVNAHEADDRIGGVGIYKLGPTDTTLALAKNTDGTFTVTGMEGAAYYVIQVGLYVNTPSGSWRNYATERIDAVENKTEYTSNIKDLIFVDKVWVDANEGGEISNPAWNADLRIYTYQEVSYFILIDDTHKTNGNDNPSPAEMYSVSAYDAEGHLLASAGLSD